MYNLCLSRETSGNAYREGGKKPQTKECLIWPPEASLARLAETGRGWALSGTIGTAYLRPIPKILILV